MSNHSIVTLDDRVKILPFLEKNRALHLYSIGDLDEFYWRYTEWYACERDGSISALALKYTAFAEPTIIALADSNIEDMKILLEEISPMLPAVFYAHLTPGLIDVFGRGAILKDLGLHYRMVLGAVLREFSNGGFAMRRLGTGDLADMTAFYRRHYPENWFDPRMLGTGKFFGCYDGDILAGVAGVHVYSPVYRAAALGSVATAKEYRNRSVCRRLTSVLCKDILETADTIGLNVGAGNDAAIRAYRAVGFDIHCEYEEYLIGKK